jgi:hypothetical protein
VKRAALLLTVVILVVGSFFAYRAFSRHRDLDETLAWMKQTYNPYENGFGGHGQYQTECAAHCEDVGAQIFSRETLAYEGCQITTVTTSNRKDDRGLRETFSLRDIDPQSIHVPTTPLLGGVSEVQFLARNNAEALTYTGDIVGKGSSSEFAMDNVAYADRFANALRLAVELCGGKTSKF